VLTRDQIASTNFPLRTHARSSIGY